VLVRADLLAQRYGVRPSALLAVDDPYLAWCVDEASALASIARAPRTEGADDPPATGGRVELGPAGLTLNGRIPIVPEPDW
jgi:hypothetical protein